MAGERILETIVSLDVLKFDGKPNENANDRILIYDDWAQTD